MIRRIALSLAILVVAGCAPDRLLPDRVGLGLNYDLDSRELRGLTWNTYWATGWGASK